MTTTAASTPARAGVSVPALRAAQVLALGGVAAYVVHAVTGAGADHVFTELIYNGLLLLAAAACFLRAWTVRAERSAWLALALGIAAWTAGDLHYTFAYSDTETPPFPSLGDAFYLAFYPASYVALVLLLRSRIREFRRSLLVDGATASLAVAALGASVLFQFVLGSTEGSPAAVATNLAYPLGDVLLLALVVGVFALTGWRPGRAWAFIGGGLAAAAIADGVYLYQVAAGTYAEGGVLDVLWPLSMLLLAQAAWQPQQAARPIELQGRLLLLVPALCALSGVGVLTYDHFERENLFALGLAIATVAAVLVRLDLTFTEKQRLLNRVREQATTDALTKLGNRRKLLEDLRRALAAGTPAILMIFDLDGFKHYNDTFGHPAGDALLARLGRKLARAVAPFGGSYRLGGDEFCVLAPLGATGAEQVIDASAGALVEHGEGFAVGSSFGAVFVPEEANDARAALRIADQRLYAHKAGNTTGRGQPQDVLLQALYEREPELHEHVRAVAALADDVGRRLGLSGAELDVLLRAAELHDVGKLAVPDEILRKDGPLDEAEWEFVRRHTLIGQRILSASPALAEVSKIVRSTHEHWNGEGYPDGLRGEEIPLAARIILACDAFVAITAERPYGGALADERARDELHRFSALQFDPRVVEAVCEATRSRTAF